MALQKEDGLQLTRRYTYLRGSWEAINSPHGFADRYNIQRTYKHKKCLHKADNRPLFIATTFFALQPAILGFPVLPKANPLIILSLLCEGM